jgi:replication fork clamp-binding protein CrfC
MDFIETVSVVILVLLFFIGFLIVMSSNSYIGIFFMFFATTFIASLIGFAYYYEVEEPKIEVIYKDELAWYDYQEALTDTKAELKEVSKEKEEFIRKSKVNLLTTKEFKTYMKNSDKYNAALVKLIYISTFQLVRYLFLVFS